MIRKLLLGLSAACLMAVSATAQKIQLGQNNSGKTPDVVERFLSTPVGKNFTAQQVMDAMNNAQRVTPPARATYQPLISEDFGKWTEGTEAEPDDLDIGTLSEQDIDDYMLQPGWSVWHCFQAGGKAYQGFFHDTQDDPGYLMTPAFDMSQTQGVFRTKIRVKNANPNATDQHLQYFVMDDNPDKRSMISAAALEMSSEEWTDVEFLATSESQYTRVMFFGWKGMVLVDEASIEQVVYTLDRVKNIQYSVVDGGKIEVTWDAVEGATSYVVTFADRETHEELAVVESDTNSAIIEAVFIPENQALISVVAKNADEESYPSYAYGDLYVDEVETPVALDATNITEEGFTANWEKAKNANNYRLKLIRTHEVTEDGEELYYFDDDFSQITTSGEDQSSTIMGMPASLDDIFKAPGWISFLCTAFEGLFGFTNMYEAYGLPGALIGPAGDYSIGDGKAVVKGTGFTSEDDVVLMVGFGTFDGGIEYFDGAQTFELGTMPSEFEVEISGGTEDSQIIFSIIDAADGGDIAVFDDLHISTTLKSGDAYTLPYATVTLPYNATSYDVVVPFTGNDKFDYTVTGYFGDEESDESNVITVNAPVSGITAANARMANIVKTGDGLVILNPSKAEVSVCTVNGKQLLSSKGKGSVNVALGHGVYIVRVGSETYKVIK